MRAALVVLMVAVSCPIASAQKREPTYEGKPMANWLKRFQKAGTDLERTAAAEAIKSFGVDAGPIVPALAEMLDDHSLGFRRNVLGILKALGPTARPATPAVVKNLKQWLALTPEQRAPGFFAIEGSELIEVLGVIADAKDAVPVLVEALAQSDFQEETVKALCCLGPGARETIPAIRRVISKVTDRPNHLFIPQDSRFVEQDPYEPNIGLHKLGPDILPLLLELLDAPEVYAKRCALVEIVKLAPDGQKVLPKLREMLRDKNAEVRFYTSVAMWQIKKDKESLSVLANLLKEDNREFVGAAAAKLGEFGPEAKESLPSLKAALERKWQVGTLRGPGGSSTPFSGTDDQLNMVIHTAIEKIEAKPEK